MKEDDPPVTTTAAPQVSTVGPTFNGRLAVGLTGIFITAMMAGLNNRVGALAFADVRGALGLSTDGASWVNSAYVAGELIAMPFSSWFAVTFSLRRFHLMMLSATLILAAIIPFANNLPVLIVLRSIQGVASGALIPLLLMAALRFLPQSIRLHGLGLYSMTATFSPNLAIWLAGQWTDRFCDWRLIYWHIIPIGILGAIAVAWGIPAMPPVYRRFREANWLGMPFGILGLGLLAVGFDQGGRLDWFHSSFVVWSLAAAAAALAIYLTSEWHHPSPFIKLQLLGRRNLGIGFTIFFVFLVIGLSGSLLPSGYLAQIQDYRPLQSAPIGLIIGFPQLMVAPLVALLLYRKWVDARLVMVSGLALVAIACFLGAKLTSEWIWRDFSWIQVIECLGQPMVIISMLFLGTSVVQPMEGPFVAGTVNILRALGTVLGPAIIGQFIIERGRFHSDALLGNFSRTVGQGLNNDWTASSLASLVHQQGTVLATADGYRLLGFIALSLIPLALILKFIPAPTQTPTNLPNQVAKKKDK